MARHGRHGHRGHHGHHHGVGHHHGIGHHHGVGHHHHRAGHHIHHHHHVTATGTPMGVTTLNTTGSPFYRNYLGLGMVIGMFSIFFLISGGSMMASGFSFSTGLGVTGTILFIIGVTLLILCIVFCKKGRLQQQQAIVTQQAVGTTTLQYGQTSVAQPGMHPVVQPVAPMVYGSPGMPPVGQPLPPGVTISYGPEPHVAYQPQPQSGSQVLHQQYQPNAPYPAQNPDPAAYPSDVNMPPPSYEDAVNPTAQPDKEQSPV